MKIVDNIKKITMKVLRPFTPKQEIDYAPIHTFEGCAPIFVFQITANKHTKVYIKLIPFGYTIIPIVNVEVDDMIVNTYNLADSREFRSYMVFENIVKPEEFIEVYCSNDYQESDFYNGVYDPSFTEYLRNVLEFSCRYVNDHNHFNGEDVVKPSTIRELCEYAYNNDYHILRDAVKWNKTIVEKVRSHKYDLSLADYHELHKELWLWLADKCKYKKFYPKHMFFYLNGIIEVPKKFSYACEEDNVRQEFLKKKCPCLRCPLPNNVCGEAINTDSDHSLYYQWKFFRLTHLRKEFINDASINHMTNLCKQIAYSKWKSCD